MTDETVNRIREMEGIANDTARLNAALSGQLDMLDAAREKMKKLFQYYGSEAWYRDRETDLPEGIKAGVLSEDLIYDEITALRDSAFRMLGLATDLLKNVL